MVVKEHSAVENTKCVDWEAEAPHGLTAQEGLLSNTECGHTIEEVEAHLKVHAFQNIVAQKEEKERATWEVDQSEAFR